MEVNGSTMADVVVDDRDRMLTTTDNPWDPFTEYDAWYTWDMRHGYDTAAYLARVVVTSDELSEADQGAAINEAIDDIVRINLFKTYRAVERDEILNERKA